MSAHIVRLTTKIVNKIGIRRKQAVLGVCSDNTFDACSRVEFTRVQVYITSDAIKGQKHEAIAVHACNNRLRNGSRLFVP
jgi:hypothetical protein